MGINSHKSVLFNVIEQIMNFPMIYGYPYLFLVHPFRNVGHMGQNPFVTGTILDMAVCLKEPELKIFSSKALEPYSYSYSYSFLNKFIVKMILYNIIYTHQGGCLDTWNCGTTEL